MGTLVASLLSLAPSLIGPTIKAVEAIFGPKTGATKLEAVVEALTPVLAKAAAAGKLPGVPDETTLKTVIEAVFQQTKADVESSQPLKDFTRLEIPPGSIVTIQFPAPAAAPEAE